MKKHLSILIIILGLSVTSIKAQSYFPMRNVETNLGPFSNINGQWIAIKPTNNTLGANYYQGINFGFDANNYVSLVNGVGTNEIYFGRWSSDWKGWSKIWHSGNLNNINSDFIAKTITSSKINITGDTSNQAFLLDVNGKAFVRSLFYVNDIMGGNGGDIRMGPNTGGNSSTIFMVGGVNPTEIMRISYNKNVGIGTANPDEKLTVNGKIHAKEVRIDLDFPAPDYVFANDYKLKSLQEVEEFIKQNSHLPEIPSAKEIEKNGLMLAEMNMSLLKKIEELTLYMIEMKKENEAIKDESKKSKKEIEILKKENEEFKSLSERLSKLENQLK